MLTVAEALHLVLAHATPKLPERISLVSALNLILAEDIASDVDSPPHDKSIVDGYAVIANDFTGGQAQLQLLEQITAGAVPTLPVTQGHCSQIMTGVPIPQGADSVVMVERTKLSGSSIHFDDDRFRPGQNIMRRATSFCSGEVVLRSGTKLGPAEIGLLAEVGRAHLEAIAPPTIAILATGNELIPAETKPTAGQIRNSNGPMLVACVQSVGAKPIELGIARDNPAELRQLISAGLQHDILLLSGGVSAGVLDLVPEVLTELGVAQVFHKVAIKPGKPIWFGNWKNPSSYNRCLVFGLPGNPISSLVGFELFVKPAIARLAGHPWQPPHPTHSASLSTPFQTRGDRATYQPAIATHSAEGLIVEPTSWKGSADLRGFAGANSLIVFPPGDRSFTAGDTVDCLLL